MDAEKFDKVVLDLLYDELDELTRASAIRHMDQSARAKALYSELRATREVGSLPLVEPPEGLSARILLAEEQARAGRPLRQRVGTLVSILAGYTMRPQLAMAALLLLMLGSSLLLLRVKPGEPSSLLVTERGVPESDKESVAIVPVSPSPAAEGESALGGASRSRRSVETPRNERPADRPSEAPAGKRDRALAEAEPSRAGPAAGAGELGRASTSRPVAATDDAYTAEGDKKSEKRKGASCAADLDEYETAAANPSSSGRSEALWAAAQCYEELGRLSFARQGYQSLLVYPAYADRARAALSRIPEAVARAPKAAASADGSEASKAAPAKPAAPGATAGALPSER